MGFICTKKMLAVFAGLSCSFSSACSHSEQPRSEAARYRDAPSRFSDIQLPEGHELKEIEREPLPKGYRGIQRASAGKREFMWLLEGPGKETLINYRCENEEGFFKIKDAPLIICPNARSHDESVFAERFHAVFTLRGEEVITADDAVSELEFDAKFKIFVAKIDGSTRRMPGNTIVLFSVEGKELGRRCGAINFFSGDLEGLVLCKYQVSTGSMDGTWQSLFDLSGRQHADQYQSISLGNNGFSTHVHAEFTPPAWHSSAKQGQSDLS